MRVHGGGSMAGKVTIKRGCCFSSPPETLNLSQEALKLTDPPWVPGMRNQSGPIPL